MPMDLIARGLAAQNNDQLFSRLATCPSITEATVNAPDIPYPMTCVEMEASGARYIHDAAVDAAMAAKWPRACFIAADGRGFRYGEPVANVMHFGAIGDGVTDDTIACQAAIDWALYGTGRRGEIYFPGGVYRTSDTLHVGYGVSFGNTPYTMANICGAGQTSARGGAQISPTFRDRPVLAITAGRMTRIRRLSIVGDDSYFLNKWGNYPAGQVNVPTSGYADAHNVSAWINPSWPASATGRYTPWAAIAIDPYMGTAPSSTYPPVSFPGFLGTNIAQYGKVASSDTVLEDLHIRGFVCGVVYTPSGNNTQNDFDRIRHCWISRTIYAVSIGHTDARLMCVESSYLCENHTGVTTRVHGQQLGQCGAAMVNTAFDRSIQWFDFGDVAAERTGPISLVNCYGENG